MLKKMCVAIAMMGVISGSAAVAPADFDVPGVSKAEAYYHIPRYLNGDKNWPCYWPGGHRGGYIDMSSIVKKDGWIYYIEAIADNGTNEIVETRTVGMKKRGNKLYEKGKSEALYGTFVENAWDIITGNSDY